MFTSCPEASGSLKLLQSNAEELFLILLAGLCALMPLVPRSEIFVNAGGRMPAVR
jgi:hypothetical protein